MAKAKLSRPAPSPSAAGGRGGKRKDAKLKVFRTPIGFHDAFVAAPSQKAALEAWGSDSNLFAAGVAELVSDPALMAEPLARPGEVVRKLRGSADEQVAALGKIERSREADRPAPAPSRVREGRKKKAPRPSRAAVDKAEAALEKAEVRHRVELDKLRAEEAALQARRRDAEREQRSERERLSEAVDAARERYRAAMAAWAE
jgi:hypothetical protein